MNTRPAYLFVAILMTLAIMLPTVVQGASVPAPNTSPTSTLFGGSGGPTKGYFIHPNCLGDQNDATKPCGVTEMLLTAINITKFILGLVGSVALLMFMYGGFLWLTSAGNAEQVKKGRSVFINAVIGIVIIFASTIIINFVVAALTGQDLGGTINIFPNSGGKPVLEVPAIKS